MHGYNVWNGYIVATYGILVLIPVLVRDTRYPSPKKASFHKVSKSNIMHQQFPAETFPVEKCPALKHPNMNTIYLYTMKTKALL